MEGTRLLVVEDDAAHATLICDRLAPLASVEHAATQSAALRALEQHHYDTVVLDVGLPDGDGFEIQRQLSQRPEAPPIVFVTSDDLAENAVTALQAGAAHYVIKRPDYLETMYEKVADVLGSLPANESQPASKVLIGTSPSMRGVRQAIEDFAPLEHPVLITGETGTGKDLVARCLHDSSGRPGQFVAANCAAITTSLFESELFGSEQGAYTGAVENRSGLVGSAEGGTLFLDEIGDIPPNTQAKLLRFLETGTYRRVGAAMEAPADVRIVAASNRDLLGQASNSFRQDLYYRLNVLRIELPALRARRSDIRELVDHFLLLAEGRGIHCAASQAAVDELAEWHWPGNVRELKHCVERTLVGCTRAEIGRFDLGLDAGKAALDRAGNATASLTALLRRHGGYLAPVAAELDVSIRTVQRRIKAAGLELQHYR